MNTRTIAANLLAGLALTSLTACGGSGATAGPTDAAKQSPSTTVTDIANAPTTEQSSQLAAAWAKANAATTGDTPREAATMCASVYTGFLTNISDANNPTCADVFDPTWDMNHKPVGQETWGYVHVAGAPKMGPFGHSEVCGGDVQEWDIPVVDDNRTASTITVDTVIDPATGKWAIAWDSGNSPTSSHTCPFVQP